MSEDPIAFSGGDENLYRYVGNDATNETDPSGMFAAPPVGLGTRDPNYLKYKKYYDEIPEKTTGDGVLDGPAWPNLKDRTGKDFRIVKIPYDGPNCLAYAVGETKPFGEDADIGAGKKLIGGDIQPLTTYYKDAGYELWKISPTDTITALDLGVDAGYSKIAVYGHLKGGKIVSVNHAAVQTSWGDVAE